MWNGDLSEIEITFLLHLNKWIQMDLLPDIFVKSIQAVCLQRNDYFF